ncbi:alkyl hydroperoxide reductase [Mangrovimonas yunxiaonensis]|uniref:Alkyl hydroperoxide reductase n=1 Tax=Mangrovimonas yunxiaonensis TaxID=1197477 RepID=A0A084TJ81_9FLAO|nr:thioredoxin family protein [Mangrovimonas yunxiaonensis]KFB00767.1 alkyl hydroperoxide reductase [Mangrovimonas yunxiaonensis]
MARTPSNMLPLGTNAPHFILQDTVSGETFSLDNLKGINGTLMAFICNHCPFVKHINHELSQLAKDYKSKGINTIAISSNDVANYPDDAPDKMKQNAIDQDFIFPYLYDQTQKVAKAYNAACTPDFYVFDQDLKLIYRGQLDDSRPGNEIPVTGADIRHALECLLNHEENTKTQKPSIGCNIKWKPEQ